MTFPEPALLSIYKAYPRKEARSQALREIAAALERICGGEIDGRERTPEEAVVWLRQRTLDAAVELGAREKKWIAHPGTFFHQSRYLRMEKQDEDLPANLEDCIAILGLYPKMPAAASIRANLKPFLPTLRAVSHALSTLQCDNAVQYLIHRTATYASCVYGGGKEALQYVPSATKWYAERRYEHDESTWVRKAGYDYNVERDQIRRVLNP